MFTEVIPLCYLLNKLYIYIYVCVCVCLCVCVSSVYVYGSHFVVLLTKQTTPTPTNTTQIYFNCALHVALHVSALSQAIIRHVNTKII